MTRAKCIGYCLANIALAIGAGLLGSSLRAQTAPAPAAPSRVQRTEILSYEGQNVSSVELAGRPDIAPNEYRDLFAQPAGRPFAAADVDRTIAALKATGKFQDVTLDLRPEATGVRVVFVAQPAYYFGVYEFEGARGFTYTRLLQVANYSSAEPYSHVDTKGAEDSLQTFLRRSGYFEATVESHLQTDTTNRLVNVNFQVTLNRRADFGEVHIEGPTPAETARLQNSLKSLHAILFGHAVRQGKQYSLKTLQKATSHLESRLAKDHHLEAHVKLVGAAYHPETNRADITFNVRTGPVVNVTLQGVHPWPWTKHKLLPMYQQTGLEPDLIEEGRKNLQQYVESKGYFDATVEAQVLNDETGERVVYRVTKGQRKKIDGVAFTGNEHFKAEELKRHVTVKKANLFSKGKYDETSVKTLKAFYQAKGFNHVRVTPTFPTRDKSIIVTFAVVEGPQDTVESLDVNGNTLAIKELVPQGLETVVGQPYSQKTINADRNRIMTRYLELGYLDATFRATAYPSANDPHKYQIVFDIVEGPQVHATSLVTLGRNETEQALIDKQVRTIGIGQPLAQQDLMTSESRLYTAGIFDWAEVNPRHQSESQAKEDVIIRVHEAKRNSLIYGIGFESTSLGGSVPTGFVALPGLPPIGLPSTFKTSQKTIFGPRFDFLYTRNNVRGKAESVSLSGLFGPLQYQGTLSYIDPNFLWSDWASTASVMAAVNKQNPIFNSRQALLSYQFKHPLNAKHTMNLILQYSASETNLYNLLIPQLVPPEDMRTRLSTFSATWAHDTRDNILDAHRGIYESAELDLNPNNLGSNVNFGRLLAQVAAYKNIHSGVIWANNLRIGLEEATANSFVPLSQKFFTGGGSTLRGFPLNGAGPQETIPACGNPAVPSTCGFITVPRGGPELFIVNSEFRIPSRINKNLTIATFYDGGNVFDRVGFKNFARNYTNNVGVGLRYATPVGPIRIDLGHNLSPIPGIKATQIFVTLGQAF
jgi:outer membrane protein assembly factor BamA